MNKFFFAVLAITLLSCEKEKEREPFWVEKIFSSFEEFKENNGSSIFSTSSDTLFIQTNLKPSTDYAFSGTHALLLSPNQNEIIYRYGAVRKGQLIEFSIWQKKSHHNSTVNIDIYTQDSIISHSSIINTSSRKKTGWKQHHLEIPTNINIDSFDIKLISNNETAYFDDFHLYVYPQKAKNEIDSRLQLYIPSKSKLKLNSYLNNAIPERIIPTNSKKYLKGFQLHEGDTLPLKFKIKGDWTDHVQPHKPSLRIKLKNSTFYGMSTFSIQDTRTRGNINEWLFHELATYMDVLTTEYSFINVSVNDYNYGLYAIEEHFTKRLLESKKRREGPILKMEEDSYWNLIKSRLAGETSGAYPFYEASMISAFGMNRINRNVILRKQYLEGAKLLAKFKNGDLDIENIFDIDNLAKYYVLCEISNGTHGTNWHNRRFYFNPITQKLEHIFYDALPNPNDSKSFLTELLNRRGGESFESLDYAIIRNEEFREKFMHYLDLFTDSTFCTNFIDNIKNDYDLFYPAIQAEYPNYRFDLNVLFEKSKMLRENKSALEKLWSETIAKASTNEYWIDERSYSSTSKPIYVKNLELNTYSSGDSINGYSVRLENFHSNELTVISIYNHTQKQTFKNTKISGYTDKFAYVNLNLTFKPDSIQYTLENIPNKIFSQKINSDPKPEGETTRMRIAKKWNPEKFQIQDDIISMSGTIIIDELILIPSNYQVNILPGTHINFIRGGGLIINSKVTALGAKDNPISITSLDSSSNGFTVINGTEFIMENASISGLNSLSYENWSLTGALCIYQTPCTLKNVTISHNFCEDALNIIRSHFEIENLSISHTFSDGFDADFCTGNFSNSSFSNTGNDCIDFSGSKVKIENIKITDSGDKGISAGEASELYLTNIYINGALSGIASKDGSKVFGDSISIKNTGVGLTAFQKKIDYSPATIKLNNCTISSTNKNVEVEKRSELFWNGILYTGTETLDIDAMYSIFDKK